MPWRCNINFQKWYWWSRPPHYDPSDVNPLGLKPNLAILFNTTITGLWMDSPDKEKIYIGCHDIECTGAIKESRYRHTKSGKYDGLHLYGSSGRKAFTLCWTFWNNQILQLKITTSISPALSFNIRKGGVIYSTDLIDCNQWTRDTIKWWGQAFLLLFGWRHFPLN